jgi:hypothetical protein
MLCSGRTKPAGTLMTLSVDLYFFGQDCIEMLIWRMESKGLTRRS